MDQLYAQVDKKNKNKKAPQLNTAEPDIPEDQPYAQVNKKKNNEKAPPLHTSEPDTPVNQLYAQENRKSKKITEEKEEEKVETEVFTEESETVYSAVNKPSAPQVPPKLQLLIEELQLI